MDNYFIVVLVVLLASITCAKDVQQFISGNSAYGYLKKIGVPLAESIQKAEKQATNHRIIGGTPAVNGQFPYQAGLIISIIGLTNRGVCGGSLISANRVITAAHCWFDGQHQGYMFEVVLGSSFLFSGGTRIQSNAIGVHPNWTPQLIRNDVAVIYLPSPVSFSSTIGPIALPSGSELNETFAGDTGIASGFGSTVNGGSVSVGLNHVQLKVITNRACSLAFPQILQSSNICTSGFINVGTCQGDSGGPLVVNKNGRPILIGISSFGSGRFNGCESILPAVFVRVTSYNDFLNAHL